MRLLIDTCVLLWISREQPQLSARAQEALAASDAQIFVSAISAFEIAIKAKKGKLTLPKLPIEWFADAVRILGLAEVPVSSAIAAGSCGVTLPPRRSMRPDYRRDSATPWNDLGHIRSIGPNVSGYRGDLVR